MQHLPLDAPTCPLCGGPNGCAAAASASFDTTCWCTDLRFPQALLDTVPAGWQGRACICRRCAQAPQHPPRSGTAAPAQEGG